MRGRYLSKPKSIIEQTFKGTVVSIILAAIAVLIGVVIDGIVIGRYLGPDHMAAYTLISPIVNIVTVFSSILSTGVQVLCAQRIGEGNIKGARQAFSVCMAATTVLSIILTLTAVIFRSEIAILLGATGDSAGLLPYASDYLLGLAVAGPASIFLFEFNSLIRLDGDPNRIIVAVAVMTVLDIAGDLLNVFVFHGGMLGIGLATAVSYLAALFIMMLHFTKKDIIFRFSFKGMNMKDFRDILTIGAPSAVGSASTGFRTIVHNHIMVGTMHSVNAVGAFGVVQTVFNFASCVLIGVGITTSMIAGMLLGEKDRPSTIKLIRIAVRTALLIGTGLCISLFVLSGPIADLFGSKDGATMVMLATRGLRFYSVSLILYGINSTFTNYLQGMRRMTYSLVMSCLHSFVFLAVPALALAGFFEADAVWVSFVIGEVLTLTTFVLIAAVLKKGIPCRAEDFLYIKEPFGAPECDVLELTVTKEDDILPAARKVKDFCTSKNATQTQEELLPLFTEKIADNAVNSGFEKEGVQSVEIRLIRDDDGFTLRLRDNCKPLDPTELIGNSAKSAEYIRTLSLNVTTIRL